MDPRDRETAKRIRSIRDGTEEIDIIVPDTSNPQQSAVVFKVAQPGTQQYAVLVIILFDVEHYSSKNFILDEVVRRRKVRNSYLAPLQEQAAARAAEKKQKQIQVEKVKVRQRQRGSL